MIADKAEATFRIEAASVKGDDASGFLPAMLERMQAKRRDCSSFRMAENAEYAAFFAQAVRIWIEIVRHGRGVGSAHHRGLLPALPADRA